MKSPAGRGPDFGGQFRVEAVLAEGGMGTVYRAIQVVLGRPVAIKVLKAGGDAAHADAAQGVRRFVAEALLAARVSDPHVVRVLTAGTGKDGPYVVYELVEGRTLRSILEAEPRLSAERAVAFAVQACHGLDAVHRAGIVHRDVKPENLLVDAEDRLKLTDLGIARDLGAPGLMTTNGMIFGTPAYMSPEQCSGLTVGPTSDLYSLGIVLFEMLTGCLPFAGSEPMEQLQGRLREAPRPPSALVPGLDPRLESLVLRVLSRDPGERPASAAELLAALEALGEPYQAVRDNHTVRMAPVSASRAAKSGPTGERRSRTEAATIVSNVPASEPRPRWTAALGAVVAASLLALGLSWSGLVPAPKAPGPAPVPSGSSAAVPSQSGPAPAGPPSSSPALYRGHAPPEGRDANHGLRPAADCPADLLLAASHQPPVAEATRLTRVRCWRISGQTETPLADVRATLFGRTLFRAGALDAAGSGDDLLVAYAEAGRGSPGRVRVFESTDRGLTWSRAATLNATGESAENLWVAFAGGTRVVCWQRTGPALPGNQEGPRRLAARQRRAQDARWSPAAEVPFEGWTFPGLAATGEGELALLRLNGTTLALQAGTPGALPTASPQELAGGPNLSWLHLVAGEGSLTALFKAGAEPRCPGLWAVWRSWPSSGPFGNPQLLSGPGYGVSRVDAVALGDRVLAVYQSRDKLWSCSRGGPEASFDQASDMMSLPPAADAWALGAAAERFYLAVVVNDLLNFAVELFESTDGRAWNRIGRVLFRTAFPVPRLRLACGRRQLTLVLWLQGLGIGVVPLDGLLPPGMGAAPREETGDAPSAAPVPDPAALLQKADSLAGQGQATAAVRLYARWLEGDPRDFWGLDRAAAAAEKQGEVVLAETALRAALRISPRSGYVHLRLATLCDARGLGSEAARELSDAARDPKTRGEALGRLASRSADRSEWTTAARLYREALESTPRDASMRSQYAESLRQLGRTTASAEQFGLAIRDGPPALWTYAGLAGVMFARGQRSEAATVLQSACAALSSAEPLMVLASLRNKAGDHAGAVEALREVIRREPRHPEALGRLADELRHLGKLPQAHAAIADFLEANPRHGVGLRTLGEILLEQGEPSQAETAWRRSLEAEPESAATMVVLGNHLRRSGRVREGLDLLRRAVRAQPRSTWTWASLSVGLMEAGELPLAMEACEDGLRRNPSDTALRGLRDELAGKLPTSGTGRP